MGSELRGDDACGILVAREIQKAFPLCGEQQKLRVFEGGTVPENLTGEIKRFNPTHLVIIDSVDSGKKPGAIDLFNPEETVGITCSTHRLPLSLMSGYLVKSTGCRIVILGIQPKQIEFGGDVSREVNNSAKKLSGLMIKILGEWDPAR
jgi:hydrogenase 3 maturation protease